MHLTKSPGRGAPGAVAGRAAAAFLALLPFSCVGAPPALAVGDLLLDIQAGPAWLHRYGVFRRNPPQMAIWVEREDGSFGGTLFVTSKAATGGWLFNGGNPRVEALPVWNSRRAGATADGITGATPRAAFSIAFVPEAAGRRFVLYAEVNQSTDFNDAYPKDAAPGTEGYSGGNGGSGQPSLVYRCPVDLDSGEARFAFLLVGHGSPDGSDGAIHPDLSGISSALGIVSSLGAVLAR